MNKVIPFSRPLSADEEAQRWIIRIDKGRLGAEERKEMRDWLARDPQHGKLLDQYAQLWHAAAMANPDKRASTAAPAQNDSRFGQRGKFAAGALGSLACALLFVAWLWPSHPALPGQHLATAVGKHQQFHMSDGSIIELNTKSAADVDYLPKQRKVILKEGEGLFQVAKDRQRPFEVFAGSTKVRAVGTRFTVHKRADGEVDVTVHEGVVEIVRYAHAGDMAASVPVSTERLAAGQVMLSQAHGFTVSKLPPAKLERQLAWQQNRVNFDETPLAAAVEEINRYSPSPIVVGDSSLLPIKISGSFSTQNMETFLRTMEQGFPLKVERRATGIFLLALADKPAA